MSNVNKFAIHNCNHLMLEQTGRQFSHNGHEWLNQIKHQSISSVTHAEALSLCILPQLSFSSPDCFPSLPLSLLPSPPPGNGPSAYSTVQSLLDPSQPRANDNCQGSHGCSLENCHKLLSVLPFKSLWPLLAIQH